MSEPRLNEVFITKRISDFQQARELINSIVVNKTAGRIALAVLFAVAFAYYDSEARLCATNYTFVSI